MPPPIELVKPAVDVGLYTDHLDEGLAFWRDEVGLAYEELLRAGRGVHQHRLTLHGAVLKLNHSREALDASPTGLACLRVAAAGLDAPRSLGDPEGVAVELVPPGHDGIEATEIVVHTSDLRSARRWWVRGLGAEELPDRRYRLGETIVRVEHDPARPRSGPLRHRGFRYLTVQVGDVEAAHAHMLDLDFEEATAPLRLGDVAYISFVRDGDGDWLELSQRASLTGALPDGVRRR